MERTKGRQISYWILITLLFLGVKTSEAQNSTKGGLDNNNINETILSQKIEDGARVISTGVPVLLISPDSRSGSMGDVGAATTPDINSIHWNAAKLAFIEKRSGISFTYTPWLRDLVGDIDLSYLAGFYKINDRNAIGASLTYFSLGGIDFYDVNGESKGNFKPNELAFDMAYSMKLSEKLSASVTGRYIRSDLTQGQNSGTATTHAANAFGADLGLYFQDEIKSELKSSYAIGFQIANLGSKISYSEAIEKEFQPANLRLGGRYTMDFNQFNTLSFMLDFNKLLVPTPPIYDLDSNQNIIQGQIASGLDPNVGVLQGAIQSFYDAPNGFKEEMQEINISVGAEWIYNKFFVLRGGYFYENQKKGGRQYITFGGGFKYNVMQLDIAYLVPTVTNNHPLKNTLRISLSFDFN
ncbi:MAG TPA: type IX secretion system outer membrane channel protein PorV [Bacteroidales bacterium]|nr:type IX secretion system outer membrane channel protein PorV [Bacteroidales bacterium]